MTDAPAASPPAEPAPAAPPPAEPAIVRRRSGRPAAYAAIAVVVVIVAVLAVAYAAGWIGGAKNNSPAGKCPTGQTLLGAGANFILPLMSQWTTSFGSQSSNTVNYNPAGSGAGITAFTGKTVDFAGTDVGLNSSQTAALTSPVVTVPITAGGLAIVYNVPGVASGLQLSGPVLANIYLGKVHTWNDPSIAANNSGVSLPNQPITTVHRSDSAGTTYILTDYFSQDSPAWASGPGTGLSVSWPVTPSPSVAEKGNSGIAKYVTANAYSIGYVDLTDSVLAKLSYAKLQNPAGNFVLPTSASVASAIADKSATTTFPNATGNWGRVTMVNANGSRDYPLATFAYFFVYQGLDKGYAPSLLKAEVIVAWLKWAVTTGQSFAAGLYYTALAATIVSVDQKAIGTLTYGGKAVPACTLT